MHFAFSFILILFEISSYSVRELLNTPNANMADHSFGVTDELHESEASQSFMFCFDKVSPEKSFFVLDLVCFILLCLRVAVLLNDTRRDRHIPPFAPKGM